MSAIGIIFSMAYLSACSNNDYAQVAEQQQNMEIPVKETYIYSFKIGKFIKI